MEKFNVDYHNFTDSGLTENKTGDVIRMRAKLILRLNKMFYNLFRFVNQENRHDQESINGKYFAFTKFVMPTLRF